MDKKTNNWKTKKLGEVCDKISLNKIKIKQKDYLLEGKFPVIDQGQDIIGGYFNDENLVVPNEPPYIIFGDHTKVKKFIPFKFIAGADGVKVLKAKENVLPKFLFYLLHTIKIENKGYARHFQLLEKENFLFPEDLETQHAIVSKIEELFSELDKGIAELKTAQQQLKTYRQSVLKSAFEGKLTNENVKNGELPDGWEWKTFSDVCVRIGDIDHKMPKKTENGKYPYLSTKDITNDFKLSFDNVKLISEEDYLMLSRKIKPEKGDIIFPRYGTIGKNVLVDTDKKFLISYSCAIIKPNTNLINEKYIYLFSLSPKVTDEIRKYVVETTQANIGIGSIKSFVFPLAPLEDQHRVVQEIESRLSVADKMEQSIQESLQKAEALRQSILKKAFCGELVNKENLTTI